MAHQIKNDLGFRLLNVEEELCKLEVGGGAYGKKLGEPLQEAENKRFDQGHGNLALN